MTDSLRFVFHLRSLSFSNFTSCNQYPCIHLLCLNICSIKREIGHLCHDERRPKVADKPSTPTTAGPSSQVPGIDLTRTYAPGMSAPNNTFARPDRVFLHFRTRSTRLSGSTSPAYCCLAHVSPFIHVLPRNVRKRVLRAHVCFFNYTLLAPSSSRLHRCL